MANGLVKWVGGKNKIIHHILPKIHSNHYIEPFLGGGSVMLSLLKSGYKGSIIVNDLNQNLIDLWLNIKNNLPELIKSLENELTEITEDQYYYLRKRYNTISNSITKSALFLILNKTCFKGLYRVNRKNEFNVPYGNYKNPKIITPSKLTEIHDLIKNVDFYSMDYIDFIEKFKTPTSTIYLDPPYFSTFSQYSSNGFDYTRFNSYIPKIKNPLIISNMTNWDPPIIMNKTEIILNDLINSKKPNNKRIEALFYKKN
jgi:DNA adenine methylase